jgi:hypothetical protein
MLTLTRSLPCPGTVFFMLRILRAFFSFLRFHRFALSLAHVEPKSCTFPSCRRFAVSVLAAMKPAIGYLRMPQSHGIATRTLKNGTHRQFGTGLVQPGKETNEKSNDIYTFLASCQR